MKSFKDLLKKLTVKQLKLNNDNKNKNKILNIVLYHNLTRLQQFNYLNNIMGKIII